MSRCLRDEPEKKPRSLTQLAGHSPVALMRGAGDSYSLPRRWARA